MLSLRPTLLYSCALYLISCFHLSAQQYSFINYSIFPKLIEGHMISDVVAVLGSINVIAAELDR